MEKTVAKRIVGDVNNYIRQKFDFRKVEKGTLGDGPVNPKDRFHQMVILVTVQMFLFLILNV